VTEKERGTADVTLVALVSNFYGEGADHLLERFARQARASGTLTVVSIDGEEAPDPDDPEEPTWTRVRLRYRHTARNRGNHEWDARRFLDKALSDEVEVGVFERAELNDWQPA
jgi:hypothetical protein